MGKVLFYVGLAILLFGQGPILLLGKLDSSNFTEYVLLTLLAGISFLAGIILTLFPNARFFWVSTEFLEILATLYPGYAPTIIGSFIGLVWAVLCGAIGGAIIAWVHNISLDKYCK